MMRFWILVLTINFVAIPPVVAKNEVQPRIAVIALDENVNLQDFKDPIYKTFPQPISPTGQLPATAKRDDLFRKSGIVTELSGYDEFAKDYLMLTVQNRSTKEASVRYPKIEISKLKALKKLLIKN